MRLRKLLATTAALVAAGAMSVAPAAHSSSPTGGPIDSIQIGGSVANTTHTVALTMTAASVSIKVYGVTTNLTCTAGSAGGVVNGGDTGVSPSAGLTLTSVSMTCPSIFPGTTVSFSLACNVDVVFADSNVHNGTNSAADIIDTGTGAKINAVDGTLRATNGTPNDCVQVTISNGCSFRVGGSATAAFDETAKATNTQELRLSANALQIKSVGTCLGAVTNGQTFTLTAAFDVYTADGLIDFQTDDNPGEPITNVEVGGDSGETSHPVNLVMQSASVSIKVYGITTNIACSAGYASGVVRGGSSGVPTYESSINFLSMTCPSIFPGTTVTMGATCAINVDFDDLVHVGLTDAGAGVGSHHRVAGTASLTNGTPTDCVQVNISNGCVFQVGGSTNVRFDEGVTTVSGVSFQDLYLSGSSLTIKNTSSCLGAVSNGQTFTLNAVFNLQSPDGLIDFQ